MSSLENETFSKGCYYITFLQNLVTGYYIPATLTAVAIHSTSWKESPRICDEGMGSQSFRVFVQLSRVSICKERSDVECHVHFGSQLVCVCVRLSLVQLALLTFSLSAYCKGRNERMDTLRLAYFPARHSDSQFSQKGNKATRRSIDNSTFCQWWPNKSPTHTYKFGQRGRRRHTTSLAFGVTATGQVRCYQGTHQSIQKDPRFNLPSLSLSALRPCVYQSEMAPSPKPQFPLEIPSI